MLSGKKTRLRDRQLADARDSYTWQTDPELAHLDASPVLSVSFVEYLTSYRYELDFPASTKRQYAIETRDGKQHIGYCSYYGINEVKGEAELGLMIGNRGYWNKGYGTDAVTTLLNHIFGKTILKRVYLKTLDSNHRAQRCFQKCGFTPCGQLNRDGYDFMLMEISRKQWQQQQIEA